MKAWIPRNLRDDGMISMNEAPSYASFVQQYVLLADHEQALAEKDLALAQANRHKEELFQKLAEKDRDIAKWRRIRTPTHGNCCTCQKCGLDHDSCRCDLDDVCDDLDQLKKAYQQLMEKAVRFGECLTDDCRCTPEEVNTSPECAFVRAQVFLKSPEVQAWKEQPK